MNLRARICCVYIEYMRKAESRKIRLYHLKMKLGITLHLPAAYT
jgi:hypothetical protein